MAEKLLKARELRIALAGPGCPLNTPPSAEMLRSWWKIHGLKYHLLPGGKRKHFLLSEAVAFLRANPEVVHE